MGRVRIVSKAMARMAMNICLAASILNCASGATSLRGSVIATPSNSTTMMNVSNRSTETNESLAASFLPIVVVPPIVPKIVPGIAPGVVGPVVVTPVGPIAPVLLSVVPILLEKNSTGEPSTTAKEANDTSSGDENKPGSEMLQAAGWGAEGAHWAAVGQGCANEYSHMGQAYANQYSHMGQQYANEYAGVGQAYANEYAGVGRAYANQYGR